MILMFITSGTSLVFYCFMHAYLFLPCLVHVQGALIWFCPTLSWSVTEWIIITTTTKLRCQWTHYQNINSFKNILHWVILVFVGEVFIGHVNAWDVELRILYKIWISRDIGIALLHWLMNQNKGQFKPLQTSANLDILLADSSQDLVQTACRDLCKVFVWQKINHV